VNDIAPAPLARGRFRATITGVGELGPIEERLGRRLVRLVDPGSKEGEALLRSGEVTLVGPEGAALGRLGVEAAKRMLERRLMDRLATLAEHESAEAVRDGLVRLWQPGARQGRA